MSSDGVLVTPVELNRNLLNSYFKFKPQAKLESFITRKLEVKKTIFTLAEVLTYLKDIIRGEKLFDLKNPSIILCDHDLEDALNMKALHVTEIRDLVLAQLTKMPDEPNLKLNNFSNRSNQTQGSAPGSPTPQRLIQTAGVATQVYIDKKAEFTLKPKFLEVVRSLPNTDPKQTVFSYEEVTLLLSTYILAHKEKFFDCRNIKLAMVGGDPLGEAFGVKAFHRCQVNNLLKNQLIPLPKNNGTDTKAEVISSGSAAVSVSISELSVPVTSKLGVSATPSALSGSAAGIVLPAFPALNKAHSTPAGSSSGNVRKRSDSESEGSDSRNKQARTELRNLAIVRPGSRSDYTNVRQQRRGEENATIIYGNDFDENVDEAEDEDADDESDANFQQEFDVESGSEEEERPPQAMGGGNQNSTDSESDVDGNFRYLNRKEVSRKTEECKEESVYWADCEREKKDMDSCDSELEPAELKKCLQCKSPSKPYIRYCGKCWRERKGWVSSYERKKKRKRKSNEEKIVYRVDTDTETDSVDKDLIEKKSSSQESLDSLDSMDRTRMNSQDSGISSMDSQELELSVKSEETSEKPSLNRFMSLDLKNVSKVESSLGSPASSMDSGFSSSKDESSLCMFCVTRKKNASLVHGRIGHQVCCYPCAKKLWRRKAECPVCRRTVERIIKLIQV